MDIRPSKHAWLVLGALASCSSDRTTVPGDFPPQRFETSLRLRDRPRERQHPHPLDA